MKKKGLIALLIIIVAATVYAAYWLSKNSSLLMPSSTNLAGNQSDPTMITNYRVIPDDAVITPELIVFNGLKPPDMNN